jgi:predicted nucleic acid-binding protein
VILLDTSFLILALVRGSPEDGALRAWLRDRTPLAISAIAWSEFLCGPLKPKQFELARRLVGDVLPFTAEHASIAADLFNHSGRRRGSMLDCMVAAVAVAHDAPLATSNPADFARMEVRGLRVVSA